MEVVVVVMVKVVVVVVLVLTDSGPCRRVLKGMALALA